MFPFIHTGNLLLTPDTKTGSELYQALLHALADEVIYTEIVVQHQIAHYRLPNIWRRFAGDQIVNYLESYQLDLNSEENTSLSISQVYQALPNLDPAHFNEVSLGDYFEETASLEKLDEATPYNIANFKEAEDALLKSVMGEYEVSTSYYQPIAILGETRKLERMLYLIYDKNKLSKESSQNIETFRNNLLVQIR